MTRPKRRNREARSAARLSAVQALYQMDIARTDVNAVINEFATIRATAGIAGEPEGAAIARADRTFFSEILKGVVRLQPRIDPEIDQQLAQGWRLARIDSILRQILRAALYELIERDETPARVVINEYIEIAKDFFEGDEPKVVNGVLDRLARVYRTEQVAPATADVDGADTSVGADRDTDGAVAGGDDPDPSRRILHLPGSAAGEPRKAPTERSIEAPGSEEDAI